MRALSMAVVIALCALYGCSSGTGGSRAAHAPAVSYQGGAAPLALTVDSNMLAIPPGDFMAGSTFEERERAYADYRRTAGHDAARTGGWFDREREPHPASLPAFLIDANLVTNAMYAEYLADTAAPAPYLDKASWDRQGFSQHYDREVARFNWVDGAPPPGREQHPVVLINWNDAAGYCSWRGSVVGAERRLPSALEYEKAARGPAGSAYPWGDSWDASRLNCAVGGPGDTTPVGSFPSGDSGYGMADAAGNAFQWTSTQWPHKPDAFTVKGSAWDDYAGVGRGASQHGRRRTIKHAIVGFRCAG